MVNSRVPIEQKSDNKAVEFKELGNDEYNKKEYLKALILYNKSITYACSKKVRSLSYANRSAVYLALGYYEECMENIKLARENDYSAKKLGNLKTREEKCRNLMLKGAKNIAEDPWNFFKLSYPANEKIPWIVDCLEVKTTDKYGRGIYATKDLKAGDVISIEESYVLFLRDDGYYKHCANCFKTKLMNLFPCIQTASMMFCSTNCMDKFYSKSIEMEIALNYDMKMLSEVAYPFGGHEKLDKFINKTDLKDLKKTIFDFDFSNLEAPEYDKNLTMCFLSLSSKKDHSVNNGSCNIYKYVSNKTANHILSLPSLNLAENMYHCGKLDSQGNASISLFRALINHSCLPNVFFISIENKIVGFVTKKIKAGEQLFCCYYAKIPTMYHRFKATVFHLHNFQCDCQECINDSFRFKLFTPVPLIMNRNDFVAAKELLKVGWRKLSSNIEQEMDYRMQNFFILCALAYYATFPY